MAITQDQRQALNGWARTQPALRSEFDYYNNDDTYEGLGDILWELENPDPVTLDFSYSSGQLTNITGSGVDIDFTYNMDGTVNTIDNQTDVLTMVYTSGLLTRIVVS